MFELDALVKAVALNRVYTRFDINGEEHFTIQNKSGSVVHLWPSKGIGRVLLNTIANNDYFYSNYSPVSNCLYYWNQDGLDFVEYNIITGEKNFYNLQTIAGWSYFSQSDFHSRYPIIPYGGYVSTDGHVYFGGYMVDAIFGYIKFNVITKEFESHQANPDPEFTHIYMRNRSRAFYIDTGSFAGVYSSYIWTEGADDYTHLRDTIVAEIATSGLSWPNTQVIFLHQDDRELVSATRRIYTPIGAGNTWKIIDIKSPSTYINTQRSSSLSIIPPSGATCLDQTGTPVSMTNWSAMGLLYDFAVQAGLTVPSLAVGIAYSTPRFVGRFLYVGHFYLGNATYYYHFLIHPDTNKAVYTYAFNKYTDYVSCEYRDYKCNFGGAFGFSSDDEIVRFISDNTGTYKFFRPDTKEFQVYNPITNPSGYAIRRVYLDVVTDPDGLNCGLGSGVETTIEDLAYFTDEVTIGSKTALAATYEQELVDIDLADVTYKVLPDKSNPNEFVEIKVKGLYMNTFALTQALVVGADEIAALGEVYSGASFIDIVGETFELKKYLGGTVSGNGAIKAGDFVLLYGYSGSTNVFDVSDWNNIQKFNLPTLATNEVTYATSRTEGVLAIGIASRSVAHFKGCAFTLINPIARTVTNLTDLFPEEFRFTSSRNLRSALGLTNSSYPDATVETQVQAYMASQTLTRAQVIDLFKNTCRWHGADMHTYGTKTVVGLAYEGILGLAGIRIEETVGSGIWIDAGYYDDEGGKALLIETNNILNLQPSEIKPVQFNLTPNVNSMGRVAGSDNYLAFIVNDEVSYDGIIRIVSKAAFEAAANGSGEITTIPTTVTIDFGGITGYGFGDAGDFDQYDTHCSNAYFCEGDDLYITCRSNVPDGGNYPCILKVDLATGSTETFAESPTRRTRAISYDGDRMLITNGTSVVVNDNFKTQIGAILIA